MAYENNPQENPYPHHLGRNEPDTNHYSYENGLLSRTYFVSDLTKFLYGLLMKNCTSCKEQKPLDDFYKDSRTKDGRYSCCKPCQLARTKASGKKYNYRSNKAWVKEYRFKNLYRTYAHKLVQIALDRKDLVRSPCEVCGKDKTDAHHDDYWLPLEVRWLCREHHQARHKQVESKHKY